MHPQAAAPFLRAGGESAVDLPDIPVGVLSQQAFISGEDLWGKGTASFR
jgi:hypothetical protein